MKTARKLPPLVPFSAAANGLNANLMFVRADAQFIDLYEEVDVRIGWVQELASVAANATWDCSGSPERALPAFAAIVSQFLEEAQVFHKLAYEAAKRERAGGES